MRFLLSGDNRASSTTRQFCSLCASPTAMATRHAISSRKPRLQIARSNACVTTKKAESPV
eukprot:6859564-Prymnesium_polylepis.1